MFVGFVTPSQIMGNVSFVTPLSQSDKQSPRYNSLTYQNTERIRSAPPVTFHHLPSEEGGEKSKLK